MLGLLCLSFVVGALGAPQTSCQNTCGSDYRPVCGSNGVTFSNACKLQLASCQYMLRGLGSIREISSGPCSYVLGGQSSCDKICDEQEVRSPICASNSIVYDNQCRFNLARCDAAKNGTTLYIVSYNDSCPVPVEPDCEKYSYNTTDLALEGQVGSGITTLCPSNYHPVCTTQGTFTNECKYCLYIDSILSSPNFNAADHKINYNGNCHRYSQGGPFGK
ncbi:agrin-like isoform X2 [Haliotis rubra]|uniref:agrin-like isoform X1 n=1 Tax=Haliotis rubra TaxID=36100 RepID=UPI001EE5B2F9|nr:agrin-like isoform X1 [Haliotis rubra]XP_046554497.1 agrin-like isoform X2 [Haliotis rubra]